MSDKVFLNHNQVISKPEDELEGLVDGGHTHVTCSNCNAILMDIWVTKPQLEYTQKVRATCPFCNDKSFVVKIKGGFHVGGYGVPKPEDENSTVESTAIGDVEVLSSDITEFTIIKASKDAKPVYRVQ